MFNAKQAREIAVNSNANVQAFVEKIGEKIEEVSKLGKFEFVYYQGTIPGDPVKQDEIFMVEYMTMSFKTPAFWQAVIDKLKFHGYNAECVTGDAYKPRGVSGDELYVGYHIRIRW